MKYSLTSSKFDTGVYHLIPSLAFIYNHNTRGVDIDVAFLKWNALFGVEFPRKKRASPKRKK